MSDRRRPSVCAIQGTGRVRPVLRPGTERIVDFEEVVPVLSDAEAREEARRCTASSPCLYCEVCELMCPDLAITRGADGRIVVDMDYCKGCGLCAHYCPKGAIRMVVE